MSTYKMNTILMRAGIYLVLAILLVVTIVPIWILLVNATRSTPEIQQGLAIWPSTHAVENYGILIGRGLNMARGFSNSLFLSVTTTLVSVYFSLLTAYGIVV